MEQVEKVVPLSNFDAVMIAEGVQEAESEEQYVQAWQQLIDSGQCWKLQGFFGRNAQRLIDQGICYPAQA